MKEFIHRTITEEANVFDEDGNQVPVRAWRTRNSLGHRSIGIELGSQRIEFAIGDEYEGHARLMIDLLEKVCRNPCELPNPASGG